ncbi:ROK family transcriptional regulator [Microbacterium abyssi]|uniref:ROK family transcriptional regulator n=1 Tax=Microbacterium abyssi TaxID=2782166 RepID=UPI0018871DB9|nr:ROK family transcriptional regulator [Microbacterium sp. A18JL241]
MPRTTWSWPVLHDAQRDVLLEVLVHGPLSRAELTRRTGMSRASLSRLSRDLVEHGVVTEGEAELRPGRGRPSETLHVRPDAARFAGIKLTGDVLYAAVVDLSARVVDTVEHPLPSREVDDVVELIGAVIDGLREAHDRIAAVGVCLAGDVVGADGRRRIVGSHFLGWENIPLADLVSARTGLPTEIGNDVQSLTAAHHWFGAGRGATSLALIGIGAGIGAGIVVGDAMIRGAHGHPGKVGHMRVSDTGPQCDRGHTGCVSSYVTIPAVRQRAGDAPFEQVIARARTGEETASLAVRDAVRALGVVIGNLVCIADVQKVIVTGEGLPLAQFDDALLAAAVADALDPAAEAPPIELHPFRFADYAWAAAVSAIRLVLST